MSARRVIVRDFFIFQIKLVLDGLKDVLLFNISIVVVLFDLLIRPKGLPRFYRLLEVGARFELWLNLHRPASRVGETDDGLFGVSTASVTAPCSSGPSPDTPP